MNKNTAFKVLRDVFHILSYASNGDLLEAARQPTIAPNISKALECLALEASGASPGKGARSRPTSNPDRKIVLAESNVTKALSSSEALRDKSAILGFAKQVGIKMSAHPKDSYARVLSRFTTAVKDLPPETRSDVVRRLQGSKLSEIEGWINVINQAKT